MAREKFITKTTNITTITVMSVNTLTAKVEDIEFSLFDVDSKADLLQLARDMYETDTIKIAVVKSATTETKLAKMPLIKFYTSEYCEFVEPRKDYSNNDDVDDTID